MTQFPSTVGHTHANKLCNDYYLSSKSEVVIPKWYYKDAAATFCLPLVTLARNYYKVTRQQQIGMWNCIRCMHTYMYYVYHM